MEIHDTPELPAEPAPFYSSGAKPRQRRNCPSTPSSGVPTAPRVASPQITIQAFSPVPAASSPSKREGNPLCRRRRRRFHPPWPTPPSCRGRGRRQGIRRLGGRIYSIDRVRITGPIAAFVPFARDSAHLTSTAPLATAASPPARVDAAKVTRGSGGCSGKRLLLLLLLPSYHAAAAACYDGGEHRTGTRCEKGSPRRPTAAAAAADAAAATAVHDAAAVRRSRSGRPRGGDGPAAAPPLPPEQRRGRRHRWNPMRVEAARASAHATFFIQVRPSKEGGRRRRHRGRLAVIERRKPVRSSAGHAALAAFTVTALPGFTPLVLSSVNGK